MIAANGVCTQVAKHGLRALICTSAANQADLPSPVVTSRAAAFRKGTGGRCSFSGNVVTVFGATGKLGCALVSRLAKEGHQIVLPNRQDPYYTRELKVFGELGQILLLPFQLKDENSIRRALKYSNVVVNMIGTRCETKNYSFEETHVRGAQRIARIAREMGVEKFIHVSALNADKNTPRTLFNKPSEFLRTKGLGEEAVREEFPEATLIRPAVMYGPNADSFVNFYLTIFRVPYIAKAFIYKKGEETFKMPVYFADVAHGIQKTVTDPSAVGKTYEFVGPHCYRLSELIDYMFERAQLTANFPPYHRYRRFGFWPHMSAIIWSMEQAYKIFKLPSPLNFEWIRVVECTSDVLSGCPTLRDLGVQRLVEFELAGGVFAYNGVYRFFGDQRSDAYTLPLRSPPLYASTAHGRMDVVTETKPFKILSG